MSVRLTGTRLVGTALVIALALGQAAISTAAPAAKSASKTHAKRHVLPVRTLLASKGTGVAGPLAPASYTLPAGAVTVSTSAQFSAALASGARNIVLADGTYASPAAFSDTAGSRIYAQHLGAATLTAGLVVGANSGPGGAVVRGLAFDVADPGKAFQGGEIDVWGPGGAGTQVLDCTFEGHSVVPVGLLALNPDGLVAQRLTFSHFTDEGIRASDNIPANYGNAAPLINSISDISIDGVTRSAPGSSNGTAEAGLFIGERVANGVQRIRIRNVSYSGIEVVNNSWDTTFSDLDIDMSGPNESAGVGIYLEHFAINDTFTNFQITGANTGINAEWSDGVVNNAAAHNTTIQNGTIDGAGASGKGNHAGVFLDEGSESTTIRNVAFANQNWAAIGSYKNTGTNDFTANTFQAGVLSLTPNHI